LKKELQRFGHRQPGCRALVEETYGIGGLIAVAVWSELGDCRRFSRSEQVVRHSDLDVSVDSSDRHRANGHLTRQGPSTSRWALFEAAMNASHRRSPDHAYYSQVKDRHDGKLAAIPVARQFARQCYHVLRNLDPDVVYDMPA
jgi:transposase